MSEKICVTVTRQEKYRFLVDLGAVLPQIVGDEPGEGAGRSPERLLGAAMANCLCSSLVFAINKFKGDPGTTAKRDTPPKDGHEIEPASRR